MNGLPPQSGRSIKVSKDQPLIGIPIREDGEEVIRYFTDEIALDKASTPSSIQTALSLAGAWKDLDDWEEVLGELDRIRHESKPTPPTDL